MKAAPRPAELMRAYYTSEGGELLATQTQRALYPRTADRLAARLLAGEVQHQRWPVHDEQPPVTAPARLLQPRQVAVEPRRRRPERAW